MQPEGRAGAKEPETKKQHGLTSSLGNFDKIKKILSEQTSSAFNKLPELCPVMSGTGNVNARRAVLQGFTPCWDCVYSVPSSKSHLSKNT